MSGPPPKSIEHRLLDGTYRSDRHGELSEKFQASGKPVRPPGLGRYGNWLWREVIEELISQGVVKRIDSATLGGACQWYNRYRTWSNALDKMAASDGAHGELTVKVARAWSMFRQIAQEYGLTPAARMRLRFRPS